MIRDREIHAIKLFLCEYENVSVIKTELKPNDRVRVLSGPMMDKEGKILEIKNKLARVAIESLGYTLVADIDKGKLITANPKQIHSA